MSSVTIITSNNSGMNSAASGPVPVKPTLSQPIKAEEQQKDSSSKRLACGVVGSAALAGGAYAEVKSWDDKFTSSGKSGEVFDKAGLSGVLNPKTWGRAIKADPKAFALSIGICVASWTGILVGASLLYRAFTGHKMDKKKEKSLENSLLL
jgi:hypothetical protein